MGWGVISIALSPCHLTSVPLAIGYVGSRAGPARSPWLLSAAFAATTLASLAALGWLTLAADRVAGDLWGVGSWSAAAALTISMATPAVVIDGKVVHAGGVPKEGGIDGWLR